MSYETLKRFPLTTAIAVGLSMALVVTGCGRSPADPDPDPDEVIPEEEVPERPTTITGVIIDANTGDPLEGTTLTISGRSADRIISERGNPRTEFFTDSGFVTFGAEGDDVIDITVVTRAPGYVSNSRRLHVEAGTNFAFDVRLLAREVDASGVMTSVPQGVSGQVATGNVADGDLDVAAPQAQREDGDASGGTATLRVPQGTQALDASGNPVPIEEVEATVIYFNNEREDALASFPGGLTVEVDGDPDDTAGEGQDGVFVSGGFAAFEMTDGAGNPINRFASTITATMEVPANTVNPVTNEPVAEGDVFPIWSYEPETGRWTFEQDGEVVGTNPDNGNLIVEFETNHLSYWNIDWFFSQTCTARLRINGADERQLRLAAVRTDGGGGYLYEGTYRGTPDISVYNAPANLPLLIRARLSGNVVGSVTTNNICAHTSTPLQLNVTLPVVNPGSVRVSIIERCEDGSNSRGIRSSAVWYRQGDDPWSAASGTNDEGVSVIGGLAAGSVTVRAENRRTESYFTSQTVNVVAGETTEVEFVHVMACQVITGGAGGGDIGE
jgi:hypothetical protein